MNDRSDLSKRILQVIGDATMATPEIILKTGSTEAGVQCALRAMVQRGELWRITKKGQPPRFHATPLRKKSDAKA